MLTDDEFERVTGGVTLAGKLLGLVRQPSAAELQSLYDVLLEDVDRPNSAVEALGYAFGNLFLEQDWLHWVMVTDAEFGDEPGIAVQDREVACSPLSMMRNRLEDGEHWDLLQLLDNTMTRLRQLGQNSASASGS